MRRKRDNHTGETSQDGMQILDASTPVSVQCWLRRGTVRQMVWIPEQHAVVGRFLRLTEPSGASEDGWEVISTGERQPEEPASEERCGGNPYLYLWLKE